MHIVSVSKPKMKFSAAIDMNNTGENNILLQSLTHHPACNVLKEKSASQKSVKGDIRHLTLILSLSLTQL